MRGIDVFEGELVFTVTNVSNSKNLAQSNCTCYKGQEQMGE